MGDLSPEQRARLAERQVQASVGRAQLHDDIAHEQLRGIRLGARLSVECVARKVGSARMTVCRYEAAQSKVTLAAAIRYLDRCGYRLLVERKDGRAGKT